MFLFVVYDVTQRDSFASLEMWLTELDTYSTKKDLVKMLVGNKIDKVGRYTVIRRHSRMCLGCICKSLVFIWCVYVYVFVYLVSFGYDLR